MEKVFPAITAVMAELSAEGISKDSKNTQQGYSFRGIDAVYNTLSSILVKHKLMMLPRVLSRDVTERVNQKGTALFYVAVEVEFDLVSSEDGSKHTIKTYGEAMDSGDKATNKAMSAAYKYAAMMAFCIPTEGDNDADATTHEVVGKKAPPTLSERAMLLESALRTTAKNNPADLDKAWAKGSALCAELDLSMPERLVELTQLYENLKDPVPF